MKIKFPLMILGYSPSRVFSIEDNAGSVCFPVFEDAEKAEAYRIFFAREHYQALEAYVIADAKAALPFFQFLFTVDPGLREVAIDPPPPVGGKKGGKSLTFLEFIEQLRSQFRQHVRRRRQQRRMAGNHRPTRTKPT